jgi:hypothetical protein
MQYIVPASDWTAEYGVIAYPNVKIINAKPGLFHYVYTINSLRYRGTLVNPNSPQRKIVLLGDSNVFGFGLKDDETISARLTQLFHGDTLAINLANGGWSLPQEVRRYLELGQLFKPSAVILHMAANDLVDYAYGIIWVAYADTDGTIKLRNAPPNPAGKLRKILPPDSLIYHLLFQSQVMMYVKTVLNNYAMHRTNIKTYDDGTTELVKSKKTTIFETKIPLDQVIITDDFEENERRYMELLSAFATLLKKQNVKLIFLTDDRNCYGSKKLAELIGTLGREKMIEYYPIDSWFTPGVDYPRSLQGHQWGREASEALATHLYQVLTNHDEPDSIK